MFDVVDPEGMPVIISLLGGGPKDVILRDNILHWNVTSDRITIFHLLATDICSASTAFNITISLVDCQCQNNGSCSPVAPRGSGFTCANAHLDSQGRNARQILMSARLIHVSKVFFFQFFANHSGYYYPHYRHCNCCCNDF